MAVVDLIGDCHNRPQFDFGDGSYFDTSSGEFSINVLANHGSSSTYFGYEFGFELVFDDKPVSGHNGKFYLDNIEGRGGTEHFEPYHKINGILLAKGGYGYTGFSNSNKVSLEGHKSAKIYMICCSGAGDCSAGRFWDLGSLITLSPPKISNLYNSMPYDGDSDVSASETSIRVGFTNNSTNVATKIAWNVEGYTGWQYVEGVEIAAGETVTDFTIPWDGFEAGKTYLIKVNLENDAGPGTDPSELSLTIRTLHRRPTLTISHNHRIDSGLEDISIHWESDKNIQEIDYTIDGSNWIVHSTGLNARSGTIKIGKKNGVDLFEDTIYDFEVTVKSTNAYDHRWDTVYAHESLSCKTDMKAYLTDNSPRDLIIGDRLHIQKTNESGNDNVVRLYVATDEMDWKEETAPNNDYYITMTQDEWDAAYRKFISPADFSKDADAHNKIPIKIRLVTLGRIREYISEYTGLLILTGDMLTAHTNVGGVVKRGKVWARPGSEPKRGVTWISTATGHWRRGI